MPSKSEQLLPLYPALYKMPQMIFAHQPISVWICMWILKCDLKMLLHAHIAQWQKYIPASQLHTLHSTYHLWEFKLMCYIREILFIHSIWQLPFQSVSGNDFTVLPAVERGSGFDQCSVAGLWDWVCDLLYGGHLELSRGNGWNAIAGEEQENGVS